LRPFTQPNSLFDDRSCDSHRAIHLWRFIFEKGPVHAMLEVNPLRNTIKDYTERTDVLRGYL
jgi:hypothetical protein